jgi:hypothetical protein
MSKGIGKRAVCLDRSLGLEEGRLNLRRAKPKLIQTEKRDAKGVVLKTKIISFVPDALEEYDPSGATSCPFAVATPNGETHLLRCRTYWLAVTLAKRWSRMEGQACDLHIILCYG